MDLVDGYDELPDHFQPKIMRALQQGHVDDEDWNGVGEYSSSHELLLTLRQDVEANRPGHKGMRLKASKSKAERVCAHVFTVYFCANRYFAQLGELIVVLIKDGTRETESENPNPGSKKRGRPKKAVDDDEIEISTSKKARKTSAQRSRAKEYKEDTNGTGTHRAASESLNGQGGITEKAKGTKRTLKETSRITKRADLSMGREDQNSVKPSSQGSKSKKKRESGAT